MRPAVRPRINECERPIAAAARRRGHGDRLWRRDVRTCGCDDQFAYRAFAGAPEEPAGLAGDRAPNREVTTKGAIDRSDCIRVQRDGYNRAEVGVCRRVDSKNLAAAKIVEDVEAGIPARFE